MTRSGIFNKYKLNQTLYDYTVRKSDLLWQAIAECFEWDESDRVIVAKFAFKWAGEIK